MVVSSPAAADRRQRELGPERLGPRAHAPPPGPVPRCGVRGGAGDRPSVIVLNDPCRRVVPQYLPQVLGTGTVPGGTGGRLWSGGDDARARATAKRRIEAVRADAGIVDRYWNRHETHRR